MYISPEMKELLARNGVMPSEELFVMDLTEQMKHFKVEELYWVYDGDTDRSLVLSSADGRWSVLNKPDIEALNNGYKHLPIRHGVDLEMQIDMVKMLYDPRVKLCDREFAENPDYVLETYIDENAGDLQDLKAYCSYDSREASSGPHWSAVRRFMDFRGAIIEVSFSGSLSPFRLDNFRISMIAPAGTFYYADEF